jgi:hypothetical protein
MLTEIKRQVTDLVPIGAYAVHFEAIYGQRCLEGSHEDCEAHGCFDYGSEYVAEIEPSIMQVTSDNYLELPFEVVNKDESLNAKSLFEGDTHDMRPRIFTLRKEAENHVKATMQRFNKPDPWEVFIKFK